MKKIFLIITLILLFFGFTGNIYSASISSQSNESINALNTRKELSMDNLNKSSQLRPYIKQIDNLIEKLEDKKLTTLLYKINKLPLNLRNHEKYKDLFDYIEIKILIKKVSSKGVVSSLDTFSCNDSLTQDGADKLNIAFEESYTIDEWCNLTTLKLKNYQLTEIPKEIGNLTKLFSLDLSDNQLTEIPKEIGNLTHLYFLSFSNNQITELPKEIGNLTNLNSLFLTNNQITELPKEIGNLTKITYIGLFKNNLTEIPKEIGNLTKLTSLTISNNKLTELPKEIGNLTNLTLLSLSLNELTEIPKEIGNLTKLTNLELGFNQLIELPKEIGNLTNLTKFTLNYNQLPASLNKTYSSDFINDETSGNIRIKYNESTEKVEITIDD